MRAKQKNTFQVWFEARLGTIGFVFLGFVIAVVVMEVDRLEPAESTSSSNPADAQPTVWTCSMHPQVQQPDPGSCPICGMDLIPLSRDQGNGAGGDNKNLVQLSARAKALAKLRTAPVGRRTDTSAEVRLLGRIEPNESTLKSITAWTGGRIERLHVKVTGQKIRAGQVIATLYSPEVFAAHQDLLVAKKQIGRLAASPTSSRQAANAALEAVRQRLRLIGVPDDTLARMERQRKPARSMAIRTPFSGTVIERVATEGAYVSTGAVLYRVANLKKLWVQLDAYESDLPRVSQGQNVRIAIEALPGEVFEGEVTFIEPTLDSRRRTALVRVELDNRDGRLRPGMFAEATIAARTTGQTPLVVPASAPLFTGRRAIVYVEVADGERLVYAPRTVRLGPRLGSVYPVVAGLAEGERVVIRGAFAVDADLQIRGGNSMMAAPDDVESDAWDHVVPLKPEQLQQLAPVLQHYLELQRKLAADDLKAAKNAAGKLERVVAKVELGKAPEVTKVWAGVAGNLRNHAHHINRANELEAARTGFESISQGVSTILGRFGNPLGHSVHLAFCPMAQGTEGASWIQQGEKIDNAYFGPSMRSCGTVRQEIPPGGFLNPPVDTPAPSG
ncbi:MAG: efflux RND transporter periplasmic adaptor subunit, partial [Nannocystaceae bacterium]